MTWWQNADTYSENVSVAEQLLDSALHGPKGLAVVKVFADGKTVPGWGSEFMPNYMKNIFMPRRMGMLNFHSQSRQPFAIIMRSVKAICIDIDGKNGGYEGVKQLGLLPHTLAETSKSGDGYHLFYRVSDSWNDEVGFDTFSDRIGIAEGVDIRAVGCVYHYDNQKWNNKPLAQLPMHLEDLLQTAKRKRDAQISAITSIVNNNDPLEIAMTHDQLFDELKQPIPSGKRNNTLFAIGSKMKIAGSPDWENIVYDRAIELGLGNDEADKLVGNIGKYA